MTYFQGFEPTTPTGRLFLGGSGWNTSQINPNQDLHPLGCILGGFGWFLKPISIVDILGCKTFGGYLLKMELGSILAQTGICLKHSGPWFQRPEKLLHSAHTCAVELVAMTAQYHNKGKKSLENFQFFFCVCFLFVQKASY